MKTLARQKISDTAKLWLESESKRLNVSQAEVIRRLVDINAENKTKLVGG